MRNDAIGSSSRIQLLWLISCLMVFVTGCPPSDGANENGTVDFGQLNPTQLKFLGSSQDSQRKSWESLSGSEQLEFAGVAQALADYYRELLLRLALENPPSLEDVVKVTKINGSEKGEASASQFNLEVRWTASAKALFGQDKSHWWTHLAWLHPGYHGYTQIKYWDPFLGLVVLFCDKDVTYGQIHIDFRDLIWHFFPNNGNIAANYDYYCAWYGPLKAYSIGCAPENELSKQLSVIAGLRTVPPRAAPETENATTSAEGEIPLDENAMNAVEGLLKAWYRDREFSSFIKYVASDNFYAHSALYQMRAAGYSTIPEKDFRKSWREIFEGAFTSPSARHTRFRGELTRELSFHAPSLPPEVPNRLIFNKAPGKAEHPFRVLDPLSAPEGSLFPPLTLTVAEKNKFDAVAWYLDHLNRNYAQKKQLFVVGYATNDPGLVREGGVQYWIYKDGKWGLAFFHGND